MHGRLFKAAAPSVRKSFDRVGVGGHRARLNLDKYHVPQRSLVHGNYDSQKGSKAISYGYMKRQNIRKLTWNNRPNGPDFETMKNPCVP